MSIDHVLQPFMKRDLFVVKNLPGIADMLRPGVIGRVIPEQLYRPAIISSEKNQSLTALRMGSSAAAAAAPEEGTAASQKNYIIQDVGNFEETQAKRPDSDHSKPIEITKSPFPKWKYGQGVPDSGASLAQKHHEIDPYAPDRADDQQLSPACIGNHTMPSGLYQYGEFSGSEESFAVQLLPGHRSRSSHVHCELLVSSWPCQDLVSQLEGNRRMRDQSCVGEHDRAMNASSMDAPYGVSEWDISGYTRHPRALSNRLESQSLSSISKARLIDIKEFTDHQQPGMSLAATVLIKATRFWVKEGTADAENSHIDLDKLRPVGQLGGVSYDRIVSTFERPRSRWDNEVAKSELLARLDAQKQGVK